MELFLEAMETRPDFFPYISNILLVMILVTIIQLQKYRELFEQ